MFEVLCANADHFPEVLELRQRVPGNISSNSYCADAVLAQYAELYSNLERCAAAPSYGLSSIDIMFRDLCNFMDFCK